MPSETWMLYGANGFSGKLIAHLAAERGHSPILAGRRAEAIVPLARKYGFDYRVFDLNDKATLEAELKRIDIIALAAGPFEYTSRPVIDACIATKTHYLDITGEISVFEAIHRRNDELSKAGVVAIPGVGFDVVPTDCLAKALAEALPDGLTLELAFTGAGGMSKGTTKTMLLNVGDGGAIRENGEIVRVPAAWRVKDVDFPHGRRTVMSIPWGDVSTAFYSTGIPNIVAYTGVPPRSAKMIKRMRPLLPITKVASVRSVLNRYIDRRVDGPNQDVLENGRTYVWAKVVTPDGRSIEGTAITPNGYTLTASSTVAAVEKLQTGDFGPGALTPSVAFGASYLSHLPGCEMQLGEIQKP